MKTILNNKTYLSMIIGVLFAYITLVISVFVRNTTFYSTFFISNIVVNLGVLIYNTVKYDEESSKFKSVTQASYILLTLVSLYLSLIFADKLWDTTIYSNVMYLTNVKMYIGIYAIMMGVILLMNLYHVIREHNNRQNSTKEIVNDKK